MTLGPGAGNVLAPATLLAVLPTNANGAFPATLGSNTVVIDYDPVVPHMWSSVDGLDIVFSVEFRAAGQGMELVNVAGVTAQDFNVETSGDIQVVGSGMAVPVSNMGGAGGMMAGFHTCVHASRCLVCLPGCVSSCPPPLSLACASVSPQPDIAPPLPCSVASRALLRWELRISAAFLTTGTVSAGFQRLTGSARPAHDRSVPLVEQVVFDPPRPTLSMADSNGASTTNSVIQVTATYSHAVSGVSPADFSVQFSGNNQGSSTVSVSPQPGATSTTWVLTVNVDPLLDTTSVTIAMQTSGNVQPAPGPVYNGPFVLQCVPPPLTSAV